MILLKLLSIAALLFLMAGCTLHPALVAARVKGGGETKVVEVVLDPSDARNIKDREIYFSIVVVDCDNSEKEFIIKPYVSGRLASKFDFSITNDPIIFYGSMPWRVFANYPRPCVFIRGSGYIFGGMKSAPMPLVRKASKN